MNIDTDTQFAFAEPVGDYVQTNPVAFTHQIDPSNGKPYEEALRPAQVAAGGGEGDRERLDEAFADLGSAGRSLAG